MKIIYATENVFDHENWETHYLRSEVNSRTILNKIQSILESKNFKCVPQNLKIFDSKGQLYPIETDKDLEKFNYIDPNEVLYLAILPEGGAIVTLVIAIIVVVAIYFLIPEVPETTIPDTAKLTQTSPNNSLGDRGNKPRINGRIPDILGRVYSIPDMLMPAYTIFVNNQEVELAYLCIGRNGYLVEEIRDNTTLISDIEGASAEVYRPYESKWQGHSPEILIGAAIPDPVRAVQRFSGVNGQKFEFTTPSTGETVRLFLTYNLGQGGVPNGTYGIAVHSAEASGSPTIHFRVGDTISILTSTAGAKSVKVLSLTAYDTWHMTYDFAYKGYATFSEPIPLPLWDSGYFDNVPITVTSSPVVPPNVWHTITQTLTSLPNPKGILCNFSAPNGLYRTSGSTVIPTSHTITIQIRSKTTGDVQGHNVTMSGDYNNSVGLSVFITPTLPPPIEVRAYISASEDPSTAVTSHNTIKWKDLYLYEEVRATAQRNVTTIYTRTPTTEGALSVKKRKLNCIVTSKFPAWNGSGFTSETYPTNNPIDCLAAISFDPYIGNLTQDKLDFAQMYAEWNAVKSYFNNAKAGEISLTLDNIDMSYEESAVAIGQAIFCDVYRRGSKIQLHFEKKQNMPNNLPVMLLSSDNTLPDSMKFTTNLGYEFEGVKVEYKVVNTGETKSIYVPEENLRKYKKLEIQGLNYEQAYWHAWRTWQKIRYNFINFECETTEEAALLRRMDKVYVADTTSLTTDSGTVTSQNGLTLTLSNPVSIVSGTIFLQMTDLLLQAISFTKTGEYEILLSELPRLPLSLDPNNAVQTLYSLTEITDLSHTFREFLINEKSGDNLYKWTVKGTNYDDRYYSQDGKLLVPPTVTLSGANPQILQVGDTYTDLGATAHDSSGNSLSVTANPTTVDTSSSGSVQILYSATDSNNQTTTISRLVLIEGTTTEFDPPTVTLIGNDQVFVEQYNEYVEQGATAVDNRGNSLTVTIDPISVDTSTEQLIVITYTATDSYNRITIISRLVQILPQFKQYGII